MFRRVFNAFLSSTALAICTGICIATCILRARSYWIMDDDMSVDLPALLGTVVVTDLFSQRGYVTWVRQRFTPRAQGFDLHIVVQSTQVAEAHNGLAERLRRDDSLGLFVPEPPTKSLANLLGFVWVSTVDPTPERLLIGSTLVLPGWWTRSTDRLTLPYWPVALLAGVYPAIWFTALARRWRRIRRGQCVRCGYDLPANPERCPECGTLLTGQKTPTQVFSALSART